MNKFNETLVNALEQRTIEMGLKDKLGDPFYFVMGMAEEMGEVIGAIKKLERGFNIREFKKYVKKHGVIYQDGAYTTLKKRVGDLYRDLDPHIEKDYSEVEKMWTVNKWKNLKDELADLYMMMVMVARQHGIHDLEGAIKEKFNLFSKEIESEITI